MEQFARLATEKSVEFVPMGRPESNFDFVDSRFPGLDTLRRILSQVRQHGGATVVIEELRESEEIGEEDEDIKILRPDFVASRVFRLTFLRNVVRTRKKLVSNARNTFIGYALIKENTFASGATSIIYESVIEPVPHTNSFIKGPQTWDARVAGSTHALEGHLYAQQNGITNCCAHVAVRTAAAAFPHGNINYRRMNQIVGIDLRKRSPGDGLDKREMVEILEKCGARCFVADYRIRTKSTPPPFQKYVYGSIESGYPAIISFETTRYPGTYHGIPIVGHTFNSDTWVPSAERFYFRLGPTTKYVPSESWVSMYIGHDDNAGSHYCIPRHFFQTQHPESAGAKKAKKPARECVAHVIATAPLHVQVNPIQAEAVGVDYLLALRPQLKDLHDNVWARRLREYADSGRLVLRPVLLTAAQYSSHLSRISDWKGQKIRRDLISEIKKFSSEKLWMIELSIPEVFAANKRKLGEVIVRAEKKLGPERDLDGLLLARVPGQFALYESGDETNPVFAFLPSGAEDHVELFGCEDAE